MSSPRPLFSAKKLHKTLGFKRSRLILTPLLGWSLSLCPSSAWALCNDLFQLQNGNEQIACLHSISRDSLKLSMSEKEDGRSFSKNLFLRVLLSSGDTINPSTQCWPDSCPLQKGSLHIRSSPEDSKIRINQGPWQDAPLDIETTPYEHYLIEAHTKAIGIEWYASRAYYALPERKDTASILLKKTKTLLEIHSSDPKAQLLINGKIYSRLPLLSQDLPLDTLKIQAWSPKLGLSDKTIAIRPFHTTRWDFNTPSPAVPAPFPTPWRQFAQGTQIALGLGSVLCALLAHQNTQTHYDLAQRISKPSLQGTHFNDLRNQDQQIRESIQNDQWWSFGLGVSSALLFYPSWKMNW